MDKFAKLVGRQYNLFDYAGAPDAERIIIVMGSGADVAHETVDALVAAGEKVGVLKVRLYRPFAVEAFVAAVRPGAAAAADPCLVTSVFVSCLVTNPIPRTPKHRGSPRTPKLAENTVAPGEIFKKFQKWGGWLSYQHQVLNIFRNGKY